MPVADGKRIPFRKQRRILGKHQETGQLVMMLQEEIFLLNISECIVLAVKRLELCNTNREMNLTYVTLMDLQ
jgi:hypothetical protein